MGTGTTEVRLASPATHRTYYSPQEKQTLKRSHSFNGLDLKFTQPQIRPGQIADEPLEFVKRELASIDYNAPEKEVVAKVVQLEKDLVGPSKSRWWIDPKFYKTEDDHYAFYNVDIDETGRFLYGKGRYSAAILSWKPGQETPPHEHGGWSVVVIAKGQETAYPYKHFGDEITPDHIEVREVGDIDVVTTSEADWHIVKNTAAESALCLHISGIDVERDKRRKVDVKKDERIYYTSKLDKPRETNFTWNKELVAWSNIDRHTEWQYDGN